MNRLFSIAKQLFLLVIVIQGLACKKNKIANGPLPEIRSLVFNQGAISTLNKTSREITVEIADYIDRKHLVAIFQLTPGATATVNGKLQESSFTENDFTQPVSYVIKGADGQSSTWTVKMISNSSRIGLGKAVTTFKRLPERDYEWYQAQDSMGSRNNGGGATCISMALNWGIRIENITRPGSVVARETSTLMRDFAPAYYFDKYDVSYKIIRISATPEYSEITSCIDNGLLVIIMPDMDRIGYNQFVDEHTSKFYETKVGGHWMIIKGYVIADGVTWYETYDPYTQAQRYPSGGELKGRNRYYSAESIRHATYGQNSWPYAYVLQAKLHHPFETALKNEVTTAEKKVLLNPDLVPYRAGM